MTYFDQEGDFLVRPAFARSESVRSALDRLVAANRMPLPNFDGAGRLWQTTKIVYEVAERVGWERGDLMKRATCSAPSKKESSRVLIGISTLGKRCIVGQERRLCPRCMSDQRWTPIEWELRVNIACHIHGCLLVHKCSVCGTAVDWLADEPSCGTCGQLWCEIEAVDAPGWAVDLAEWLHTGVTRSMRGIHTDGRVGVRLRLDKLLLILDVLRYEIMPQWLSGKLLADLSLQWAVQLIRHRDFRSWLWSEIFLHAAKDPMTMAKALMPTSSGLAVSSYFSGFMHRAPVPDLVIANLEALGEQALLRKLSKRCRFNAHIHGIRGVLHMTSLPPRKPWDQHAADWESEQGQPRPILTGHEVREMLAWAHPWRQHGASLDEDSEHRKHDSLSRAC